MVGLVWFDCVVVVGLDWFGCLGILRLSVSFVCLGFGYLVRMPVSFRFVVELI